MTIELGTDRAIGGSTAVLSRFLVATVFVASVGCASAPQPATPTIPLEGTKEKPPAERNGGMGERPPQHTVSASKHYQAQKIYLRALEIFEQKEYDLAYLEFGRALDVDPNYHLAWFKKGLCAYYKQRYDLEIDCYRRCLEIQPDHLDALVNLANAYLAQDQLERAVPIYRRILVLEPNHPVALYNLGICYFDLQDYPACIEHLHRFIDAHPQDGGRGKAEELLRRARAKREALDTQR
jgi:tetratricopeptide (TPR) repeat protein